MYHKPVLLPESIEGLRILPDGLYVDATFGGGGHGTAIFSELTSGKLFAFDQDQDAAANIINDPRFIFIPQNFRYMRNFLMLEGVQEVDGIFADLGVSSHQFDVADKGFSTRLDGQLDMRMSQNNPLDARSIVNQYSPEELKRIFKRFGEIDNAWQMAEAIVARRTRQEITRTFELRDAVQHLLPRGKENKVLAQLFQALRIEVNQEITVLEEFLGQCVQCLKPGGRLVVISYHSLEDRLVKNFMRAGNAEGAIEKDFFGNLLSPLVPVSRKVIVPGEAEINNNSRARSARLRIAEKK
ncbi:MAG: 16S rRNA (cytosine(1402)-N(4))-methyltransferase RsmH [Bacteroidales bacterium]|nr:16S rRNA (cytosine(1402)-N(4))-methyltransferase RsmH [Bacteroidales bacterium]